MTDDAERRRRSMTPRIRRLLDARDEIMGDAAEDMAFLHALLAQTALPYRAPDNATEFPVLAAVQATYRPAAHSRRPAGQFGPGA